MFTDRQGRPLPATLYNWSLSAVRALLPTKRATNLPHVRVPQITPTHTRTSATSGRAVLRACGHRVRRGRRGCLGTDAQSASMLMPEQATNTHRRGLARQVSGWKALVLTGVRGVARQSPTAPCRVGISVTTSKTNYVSPNTLHDYAANYD